MFSISLFINPTVTTWEIVRRWLDPRTQAKIEILGSGPENNKKLLQYIDPEHLPKKYGGTARDWVSSRPVCVTEFVQLARLTEVKKVVSVPAGQTLYVDSYVTEGEIELEVYIAPMQFPPSLASDSVTSGEASPPIAGNSGKVSGSTSKWKAEADDLVQLCKMTLVRPEAQSTPFRVIQDYANPTNDTMTFTVKWYNQASIYARPLVLNIFTQDINDPPPCKSHF